MKAIVLQLFFRSALEHRRAVFSVPPKHLQLHSAKRPTSRDSLHSSSSSVGGTGPRTPVKPATRPGTASVSPRTARLERVGPVVRSLEPTTILGHLGNPILRRKTEDFSPRNFPPDIFGTDGLLGDPRKNDKDVSTFESLVCRPVGILNSLRQRDHKEGSGRKSPVRRFESDELESLLVNFMHQEPKLPKLEKKIGFKQSPYVKKYEA